MRIKWKMRPLEGYGGLRSVSQNYTNYLNNKKKTRVLFNESFTAKNYFCGMKQVFFTLMAGCILAGCAGNDTNNDSLTNENESRSKVTPLSYSIVASYPHDTASYTQGLEFYNGQLLEGTGNYGKSKLRQLDLATGKVTREIKIDTALFGEGITVLNDTLYQLTWKEKKVLVYTAKDFKKIKELPINTEGWGITNNGKELIVTDGSSNLYFYEPGTFRLLRVQGVTMDGVPTAALNELEYINGFIYANQYETPYLFKIDQVTGEIVARVDLTEINNRIRAKAPYANVLNGIAYHRESNKIYVTGKWWPELYEISFSH